MDCSFVNQFRCTRPTKLSTKFYEGPISRLQQWNITCHTELYIYIYIYIYQDISLIGLVQCARHLFLYLYHLLRTWEEKVVIKHLTGENVLCIAVTHRMNELKRIRIIFNISCLGRPGVRPSFQARYVAAKSCSMYAYYTCFFIRQISKFVTVNVTAYKIM